MGTSANPPSALIQGNAIVLAGRWRHDDATRPSAEAFIAAHPPVPGMHLAGDNSLDWDSTLLLFIAALLRGWRNAGLSLDYRTLPDGLAKLIELNQKGEKQQHRQNPSEAPGLLVQAGKFGISISDTMSEITFFVGELTRDIWKALCGDTRMRIADLSNEFCTCGPRATPIISLISFLMGLILAFISSIPLKWFQAENYVASLVGIGMLRLMAPVMVGIVMAGRTSASYAAQLGSMTVNEEIDSLYTLGVPPMQFLVLPRFLAMSLSLPLLCIFADLVSVIGGMVVAVFYLNITPLSYWNTLISTTRLADLFVGVFTAWVLGMLDAICGCYQGIRCGRSAAAVGNATTAAVVSSIICIVIAVSLITVLSVVLGI